MLLLFLNVVHFVDVVYVVDVTAVQVVDDVPECNEVVEEKCTDVTVGYTTEPKCEKWARYKNITY